MSYTPPLHTIIAQAYGSTLLGPEVEACAGVILTPWTDLITRAAPEIPASHAETRVHEAKPAYWRNGAWLDLAEALSGLQDRGFTIVDYDPYEISKRDQPVQATFVADSSIVVQVRISHVEAEPYVLWVFRRRGDQDGVTIIATHTTTRRGLLRTVDALLAGRQLGVG